MSVAALGKQLASSLHQQYLKPRGFRKVGATFIRERTGYFEMYSIQGSSWNSGGEPWEFYLNVGVQLVGVPMHDGTPATRTSRHAEGRSSSILPDTPQRLEVAGSSVALASAQVADIIERCSHILPELLAPVRARAQAGFWSALPVPGSWNQHGAT